MLVTILGAILAALVVFILGTYAGFRLAERDARYRIAASRSRPRT